MALPNLTREAAIERAALVTVDNYRIELDLTDGAAAPGEKTFRSVTTVTFDATAGADTYIVDGGEIIDDHTVRIKTSSQQVGLPVDFERCVARADGSSFWCRLRGGVIDPEAIDRSRLSGMAAVNYDTLAFELETDEKATNLVVTDCKSSLC